MSDIDTVRAIVQDLPQYISATSVGDGFTTDFVSPYAPITALTLKVYFNGVLQSAGYTENDSLGVITFTTAPASGVEVSLSAQTTLLTDAHITLILALYSSSESNDRIQLTAADCLDIIASSQALIQKKVKLSDQEVDGPALAKALRDHADRLRKNVKEGNESTFDIIEQINDIPGYKEKIFKDFLRNS